MRKLTSTLLLFFALFAVTDKTYGQERMSAFMNENTPEERAEMQTRYMQESLSLTADQTSRVSAVNLKYSRKMQDAYNSGGSRIQKLRKMKAVNQEKDNEIKDILTPDQYVTYEKNKEEMKDRFKEEAKERRKGN